VYCSVLPCVLQCFAVCCIVLQCTIVFCSVLQCTGFLRYAAYVMFVLYRLAARCNVKQKGLQGVAVCCSVLLTSASFLRCAVFVLQFVTVYFNVLQCIAVYWLLEVHYTWDVCAAVCCSMLQCVNIQVCVCTYIYTQIYIYICVSIYKYTDIPMYEYRCIHIYIYVFIYLYIHIYKYTYIYVYI